MSTRLGSCVRGALSVEAALLYPFVILVIFALMQCGMSLYYRLWMSCVCEEAATVFAEEGGGQDAARRVSEHLDEKNTEGTLLSDFSYSIERCGLLSGQYELRLQAGYHLIFSQELCTARKLGYRSGTAARNELLWLRESGERISAVKELFDKYEAWIEELCAAG